MAGFAGTGTAAWRRAGYVVVGLAAAMAPVLLAAATTIEENEASAIRSVMKINMAESEYSVEHPASGYACSLKAMVGDPEAHKLPYELASGTMDGYRFTIVSCVMNTATGARRVTGYTLIAQPSIVGTTGNRAFCSDETGEIKFDPTGGTNCTQVYQ